jgi:hypothetical protein
MDSVVDAVRYVCTVLRVPRATGPVERLAQVGGRGEGFKVGPERVIARAVQPVTRR